MGDTTSDDSFYPSSMQPFQEDTIGVFTNPLFAHEDGVNERKSNANDEGPDSVVELTAHNRIAASSLETEQDEDTTRCSTFTKDAAADELHVSGSPKFDFARLKQLFGGLIHFMQVRSNDAHFNIVYIMHISI